MSSETSGYNTDANRYSSSKIKSQISTPSTPNSRSEQEPVLSNESICSVDTANVLVSKSADLTHPFALLSGKTIPALDKTDDSQGSVVDSHNNTNTEQTPLADDNLTMQDSERMEISGRLAWLNPIDYWLPAMHNTIDSGETQNLSPIAAEALKR